MTLIKSTESAEAATPPELFQAIARLGGEAAPAGILIDTAGLMPMAAGARVQLQGGQISTSDGPFGSDRDVVGGYAIFDVRSKHEAVECAKRFMEVHKELWKGWEWETEVRQMIQQPNTGAGAARD